jgi:hypothetical protein
MKITFPVPAPGATVVQVVGGTTFEISMRGAAPNLELFARIGATAPSRLVAQQSTADGFLQMLLGPSDTGVSFPGALSWSATAGPRLDSVANQTFVVPINQTLLLVELKTLTLRFQSSPSGFDLVASFAGNGKLGPLELAVSGVGLTASLHPNGPANLDLEVLYKPPEGMGVVLDTGGISGGGFLFIDAPNGRYAGILELEVFGVAVKAIGLIDTRLPGGESGFSFLVVLSAEFSGLQIGFGFTLNGVGGIFGIFRGLVADALRDAVLRHSIDHILFARNPVANAAEIISDLRAIFPPTRDEYVFGPMAKVGWGTPTLAEGELGIILDLPRGVFAILGSLSAFIPVRDAAVVEFHLDFVGTIDPVQKVLQFFASLHDSRIAIYTLRGDMAMQLTWGDPPSFLFSLGGFNPHYQPPPAFPPLQRLSLDLGFGDNPRLSMQNYLAVTSNTFQFGAKAELYAAAGPFNLHGWFGFDALFILAPLSFIVDFDAGIDFREDDNVLAGLHVHASLSGPRPWHVEGEASISILFFHASVSFTATVGDTTPASVPAPDIDKALSGVVSDAHNWSADPPPGAQQVVSIRPPASDKALVLVDPVGGATLRERILPLNRTITKFAETKLAKPQIFKLSSVKVGGMPVSAGATVQDYFAPAQFDELTDQQKLSSPSFDRMDAGFSIAAHTATQGDGRADPIVYDTIIYDVPLVPRAGAVYALNNTMHAAMLGTGNVAQAARANSGFRKYAGDPLASSRVNLPDEAYVVASATDLTVHSAVTVPTTRSGAFRALSDYISAHPDAADSLQVVAANAAVGRV